MGGPSPVGVADGRVSWPAMAQCALNPCIGMRASVTMDRSGNDSFHAGRVNRCDRAEPAHSGDSVAVSSTAPGRAFLEHALGAIAEILQERRRLLATSHVNGSPNSCNQPE